MDQKGSGARAVTLPQAQWACTSAASSVASKCMMRTRFWKSLGALAWASSPELAT